MGLRAPSHTQTPNELFDEWLPLLGLAELKVLMVIIRKTFGWHKIRDRISLSQLEKLTGLERRHVLKATKTLVEKSLISKYVEGKRGTQSAYYELVVDDVSNNFYQCPKDTGGSVPETPGGSVFKTPTKETSSKEKERTTPTPSKGKRVIEISQPLEKYGKFVQMKKEEHQELISVHGKTLIEELIEEMNDYLAASGKNPYKDYPAAIRQWIKRRKTNPQNGPYSKSSTIVEDVELVNQIHRKYSYRTDITFGSNYIEFNFGPMNVPHIKFTDKGFREQVLNCLRKMNLPTEGL